MWFECLVEDLFESSKYSPLVRPVNRINDTITIDFSIQLSQIISVVSMYYLLIFLYHSVHYYLEEIPGIKLE